jgi:hypothetical protein
MHSLRDGLRVYLLALYDQFLKNNEDNSDLAINDVLAMLLYELNDFAIRIKTVLTAKTKQLSLLYIETVLNSIAAEKDKVGDSKTAEELRATIQWLKSII